MWYYFCSFADVSVGSRVTRCRMRARLSQASLPSRQASRGPGWALDGSEGEGSALHDRSSFRRPAASASSSIAYRTLSLLINPIDIRHVHSLKTLTLFTQFRHIKFVYRYMILKAFILLINSRTSNFFIKWEREWVRERKRKRETARDRHRNSARKHSPISNPCISLIAIQGLIGSLIYRTGNKSNVYSHLIRTTRGRFTTS